jgi:hypothetical protein
VRGVTTTQFCPAGITPRPPPPDPLTLSSDRSRAGTGAWLHAVLLTLLAWAALVCTGLGGAVGVASQSFANKLAANVQHLQRQGGTSLASRTARRDPVAATSVQQLAQDSQALASDVPDGPPPTAERRLRIDTQQADEATPASTEPHHKPHNRAHPSRAPPFLA